jgi:hypothetical protein
MSRYEENLNFLRGRDPALARLLESLPVARCRLETARNGQLTLIHSSAAGEFYFHSKFDPLSEALKFVAGRDLNQDYIVLMGLGLGYHLPAILDNKPGHTRVLLVEPDLEIVKASLNTVPWSRLLTRTDFFYFFGTDLHELSEVFQTYFTFVSERPPEFIELPVAGRLFRPLFTHIRQKINDDIRILVSDFKTKQVESAFVFRNILKNVPNLLHTRPARHLEKKFAGVPGFIVGAGPSLDANVLELQGIGDRAIVIAVDTALKPLLARGIQPHFTAVADPSHKNYLHLQGTEKRLRHWLVAEPAVAAPIYRDFGDRLISVSIGRPLVRMIEENSQRLGDIDAWGSVISLAVGFAIHLGLDPIVFLGQDFAFTHMRNHCRHSSWEERWMESTRELDDLQRREAQSIRGNNRVIETTDLFGRTTLTSDRLLMYKNFLSHMIASHPEKRFINASAGGIFTEIPWQPLTGVLAEHVAPRSGFDFSALHRLPNLSAPENRSRLVTFFGAKSDYLKKYGRRIDKLLSGLATGKNLDMNEAERLKNQLYENPQNGELVEMWSQNPIYDFIRQQRNLERNLPNAPAMGKVFTDYFTMLKPQLADIQSAFQTAAEELGR